MSVEKAFSAGKLAMSIGGCLIVVGGVYWQVNQNSKSITEVERAVDLTNQRITRKIESDNDKYARRDDVQKMEERIVGAIQDLGSKLDRVIERGQ